jgi:hypothetical protein
MIETQKTGPTQVLGEAPTWIRHPTLHLEKKVVQRLIGVGSFTSPTPTNYHNILSF